MVVQVTTRNLIRKKHRECKFDQNPYENDTVFENYCQNPTVSNPNFITSVTGTVTAVCLFLIRFLVVVPPIKKHKKTQILLYLMTSLLNWMVNFGGYLL